MNNNNNNNIVKLKQWSIRGQRHCTLSTERKGGKIVKDALFILKSGVANERKSCQKFYFYFGLGNGEKQTAAMKWWVHNGVFIKVNLQSN